MSAVATFNEKCELNAEERTAVQTRATEMLLTGGVESYMSLGKKDVCLKRESVMSRHIEVFSMSDTLDRNEQNVNRFNNRKKH